MENPVLLNTYSRAPRYSMVASAIADEIEGGRYGVGEILPSEAELRQRFGVSRHTVREALRELKERGLVSSHPGIGTRVRASVQEQRFVHGVSSIHELLQMVESTRLEVIETRELVADESWAKILRCAPDQHWVETTALRLVPGETLPIGLVFSYIRPEYSSIIPQIGRTSQPIFVLIEQHFGIRVVEIRQEVAAATLDEQQAAKLQIEPGSLALKIIRHHLDAQDHVTQASIGFYPTQRSSYITSFRVRRGLDNESGS